MALLKSLLMQHCRSTHWVDIPICKDNPNPFVKTSLCTASKVLVIISTPIMQFQTEFLKCRGAANEWELGSPSKTMNGW